MKKILLSAAVAASMLAAPSYADTVRIGTEGAYAPWNYVDDSGKLAGYEIDLGNAICAAAQIKCEFVANEWDSIIPNLVAGNYDAIMAGMSITDERKQTIDFSEEYYPPSPSLYAASAGVTYDFDNLKGLKIGVQGATIQADYVKANLGTDNDILNYETADQSVADLAAGNIDLLLADGDFLKPVVEGSGGSLAFVGPEVRIGGGVGIGMRKTDADLQAAMAKALEMVKADGTVDKLIKEYFDNGPFYSN
ncbi:MAG: transporter substrate-binding domain-containing protein [Acidiferrobacterales bacterium]|nr:transporter substrate-binding domain-containing protein [Acidiferrobacterales bacterium]